MGALREARSQLAAERTPDPPDGTAPPAAEQAGRCTAARRQAVSLAALTATHCRSLGRDGPATVPGGYLDTPPRRSGHGSKNRCPEGVGPHPRPGTPKGVGPHPGPGTPRGWAVSLAALTATHCRSSRGLRLQNLSAGPFQNAGKCAATTAPSAWRGRPPPRDGQSARGGRHSSRVLPITAAT